MREAEKKLNIDIFKGTAGKKVLFQPRIIAWYDDKVAKNEPFPKGYEGLTKRQLYEKLDVSNRVYDYYSCFERIYDKSIKYTYEKISEYETKHTYTTPIGSIYSIIRRDTSNYGSYPSKFWIETADDIRVRIYMEEATVWRFNEEKYKEIYSEWGDFAQPTTYILRTNIQECIVQTMGVENTFYAYYDETELMEKYFAAIDKSQESLLDEIIKSPIQIINYGDNLHCGILPPEFFERYIIPTYLRRREKLKPAGKFLHSHWDGDVKHFLKYAKICGLDGIEAITPKPQGDVEIEEVKDALGDDIVLLDGLPAILFGDTYSVETLLEYTEKLIKLFAGRLILGISDEMHANGDINRVLIVRDYVNNYNKRV